MKLRVDSPDASAAAARLQPLRATSAVPRHAAIIVLLAAFSIVALIPFLTCSPLPLPDYQNHMARIYIEAELRHSPLLQRYYEIHWQILPNLAMDLAVPQLARIMPLQSAMLAFTALTLGLLVAGCFAVHRVLFGSVSYGPFAVFLLLYNRQFLFGTLNYLFSLGLALLIFALWVVLRRKPLLVRCAIFVPLVFVVFVSHLAGFGVLGVLIGGYEFNSFLQQKDYRALRDALVAAGFAFGLSMFLFVMRSPTSSRATPSEPFGLKSRLAGLLEAFHNYNMALDFATFLFVVGAFGLALLRGKARLHRRMLLPLLALMLIYCIIPSRLLGTYYADRRLVPAIFLVLICSLEWKLPSKYLLAGIGLLFMVRTGVIVKNWSEINRANAVTLDVIEHVSAGTKVATAVGLKTYPLLNNPPLGHLPMMAVIRKQVLINGIYAGFGYETLRLKPEYEDLRRVPHLYYADNCSHADEPHPSLFTRVKDVVIVCKPLDPGLPLTVSENPFQNIPLTRFDYLLLINKHYFPYPVPPMLRPVYTAGDNILYQVMR
jgi:hypothetical protein